MSSGMWMFMALAAAVLLAILIGLMVWATRSFSKKPSMRAQEILEERFARGEIDSDEFEQRIRGRSYLEVDGRGTRVAAAVARKLGVRRFVYLSGAGAGQGRPQPWFQAKDMAEAAIRESGMEYALLRPSWIYGAGDRSMSRFVTFVRYLPVVPVIGDGNTPVYPIYVKDVARCVAEAVRREDARDKALELGGPDRLTMDEIIRTVQRVLGRRRPLLHHPAPLMKLLVWPMTLLPEPILSPAAIDFILQEVDLDPKPAMAYFGFAFRKLEEGLRDYLR